MCGDGGHSQKVWQCENLHRFQALERSHPPRDIPILPIDDTLAQLARAAVFSKVDANSGFWQIPLADDSQLLTTFITPHSRYCFRKLPFGISSAPELYQWRMSQILSGLDGIVCHSDNVLMYGSTQEEHHTHLHVALSHLQTAGVTLNADKCLFSQTSIKFLGHLIDKHGVHPDPERVAAVHRVITPKEISQLRRFMGMVNQLGKSTPNLSSLSQPLWELLSSKRSWCWGPHRKSPSGRSNSN